MRVQKRKVSLYSIERQNSNNKEWNRSIIRKADKLRADICKKERLKACLCMTCYYVNSDRMGGAAMTEMQCGICDTLEMFGSTAIDRVCLPCAKEHNLCKRCGADIELKNRRSRISPT